MAPPPRHLAVRQGTAPTPQTSTLEDPERSLPDKSNPRHPKTYLAVLSGTVSWPRTSSRVIVRSTGSKLSKSEECGGNRGIPSAGKEPQNPTRAPTTSECARHRGERPFIDGPRATPPAGGRLRSHWPAPAF